MYSPVELYRVPTNLPTDDRQVQSYTSYETSIYNSNAGLDNYTATDPAIIIPSELQRGTVEEVKKSDLGKASLKITGRQGELYIMLRKKLYTNSSRFGDRDLR